MHLQQARRIGADAEHRGVGERELSGIADKNVEPDRQQDVDGDEIADEELIAVGERRNDRADREQDEQDIAPAEGHYTLRALRKLRRPLGRSTSTIMITRNGDSSITLEWM